VLEGVFDAEAVLVVEILAEFEILGELLSDALSELDLLGVTLSLILLELEADSELLADADGVLEFDAL
jgi:hypothetical protein